MRMGPKRGIANVLVFLGVREAEKNGHKKEKRENGKAIPKLDFAHEAKEGRKEMMGWGC